MALTYTPDPALGSVCPHFTLPATNGRTYSRENFEGASAFLVMFICNHCPYVKAIEDRLIALGHFFIHQDVKIAAICSNDASLKPDDSFEKLKERAEAKAYPFPYLHDESQAVARLFGAVCTPDFFLFDGDMKLAYRGRLDDSWKDSALVAKEDLKEAIQLLLNGQQPDPRHPPSMGCSIKWKANPPA